MRVGWIFLVLAQLAPAAAAFNNRSEFKGYVEISRVIRARAVQPGVQFNLANYLGEEFSPDEEGLLDLMGTYKGTFPSKFRNGTPNVLNMLLWNVIMESLSNDLAGACSGDTASDESLRKRLNSPMQKALQTQCQWPSPEASTEGAMYDYWTAWMGFDAADEEFAEWRRAFGAAGFAPHSAAERLAAMTLGILMHPEFLLR